MVSFVKEGHKTREPLICVDIYDIVAYNLNKSYCVKSILRMGVTYFDIWDMIIGILLDYVWLAIGLVLLLILRVLFNKSY